MLCLLRAPSPDRINTLTAQLAAFVGEVARFLKADVYSHRHRIVIPLTRRYEYRPYWWPQGQYHWSPFGLERWGYWCEGAGAHRLSC
jgi:hypothetical protein